MEGKTMMLTEEDTLHNSTRTEEKGRGGCREGGRGGRVCVEWGWSRFNGLPFLVFFRGGRLHDVQSAGCFWLVGCVCGAALVSTGIDAYGLYRMHEASSRRAGGTLIDRGDSTTGRIK